LTTVKIRGTGWDYQGVHQCTIFHKPRGCLPIGTGHSLFSTHGSNGITEVVHSFEAGKQKIRRGPAGRMSKNRRTSFSKSQSPHYACYCRARTWETPVTFLPTKTTGRPLLARFERKIHQSMGHTGKDRGRRTTISLVGTAVVWWRGFTIFEWSAVATSRATYSWAVPCGFVTVFFQLSRSCSQLILLTLKRLVVNRA